MEAERVRALRALRSSWSKNKLAAGKWPETHFLSNEEMEKWIDDYVERETAVARKLVEDVETAIQQEQDDMRNADKAGWTTTKPETTFVEMLNAIGDGLSDLASSNDGENDGDEDDDEGDAARGMCSEDDEPRWVMGIFSKTGQYRMERFRQKQMIMIDEMTQRGWGDVADYFRETNKKYGTTELKVPAVVQPQTADNAASSVLTTFGVPMETLHSIPGKLQMPQVTSWQGRGHMTLGSRKPQTHERILTSRPPFCQIGHQSSNQSMMTP